MRVCGHFSFDTLFLYCLSPCHSNFNFVGRHWRQTERILRKRVRHKWHDCGGGGGDGDIAFHRHGPQTFGARSVLGTSSPTTTLCVVTFHLLVWSTSVDHQADMYHVSNLSMPLWFLSPQPPTCDLFDVHSANVFSVLLTVSLWLSLSTFVLPSFHSLPCPF